MCLRPIDIKVPHGNGYRWISVPCRTCMECLRQKQNDATVKIVSELSQCHGKACFLTLTYRPSSVPYVVDTETGETRMTLRKSDFTAAIKRFRSILAYNGKGEIRLSYCGEYGSHTFRPHFHCIIYGRSVSEVRPFLLDWHNRFGYTQAKNVDFFTDKSTVGVGRYLAKYASKGVFSTSMPIFQGKLGQMIERPFFRDSNYLGLRAFLDRLDYYLDVSSRYFYKFWDEFLFSVSSRFRFNVGTASYRLPNSWRSILLCKKSSKKLSPIIDYVKRIINVKVVFSPFKGKVRQNYEKSVDALNDRFFVNRVRSSFPNARIESCFADAYLICQTLEKESADKYESLASFASNLGKFYARSFC